jgi:hypothetical protein
MARTIKFPDSPFTTRDFSMKGGGIDFLGLRAVNLRMLAQFLIPGLNNATRDFGNFCVAAWIPWKFAQTHGSKEHFTEANYWAFQERIEVALAHGIRWDAPSTAKYGTPHGRIGDRQQIEFPNELRFSSVASRTEATSLFAAALYGPSMRYLGFLSGYYEAAGGDGLTWIPASAEDEATNRIVKYVDDSLGLSRSLSKFTSPRFESASQKDVEDLCVHGLTPPFYRSAPRKVKEAFLRKLFDEQPDGSPNRRLLTARLIRDTIAQIPGGTSGDLRQAWHTGLVGKALRLKITDHEIAEQRECWAIFQARQLQRYILETFLRIFELALADSRRSIEAICAWTRQHAGEITSVSQATFGDLVREEALGAGSSADLDNATSHWNKKVDGSSLAYEWIDVEAPEDEPGRALRMLARWFIRTRSWPEVYRGHKQLQWDGANRVSIAWFVGWLEKRLDQPIDNFLEEVFSELVFSQHLRTALSRYDGQIQRLRFLLGDDGIVPTRSSQSTLGQGEAPWMADRLDAFLYLLSDLDVVKRDKDGVLAIGPNTRFLGE